MRKNFTDYQLNSIKNEDKDIEQQRYNKYSSRLLDNLKHNQKMLAVLGADNFLMYLRPPYLYYHQLINDHSEYGKKQLDLCCGNGMHSFTGAKKGASVIALDYAEKSIAFCKERELLLKLNVDFRTSDVQTLSFENESFDIVSCVGSLSYLDDRVLFKEVHRVLKKDGVFICLDSFNHNPIYRFNRWIHYLFGNRTYSTLSRIPDLNTINLLKNVFENVEVRYFGTFVFIAPILSRIISMEKTTILINKLDHAFRYFNRFAFKVVILANK